MTTPPQARQQPHEHTEHGVRRPDPYHWMRRLDAPDLLAHLEAERDWYRSATGHLVSLVEALRSEMLERVPATDPSVSWRYRGSSYYTLLPAGREYRQLLRDFNTSDAGSVLKSWPNGVEADEHGRRSEVLLDANLLADQAGTGYVELGLTLVSPDGRLLAYSVDTDGDEVYRLHFRDLSTGEDLADEVPRSYYGGAWSADSNAFLYTVHDEAYRPYEVRRHVIGTPTEQDTVVQAEPDQRFEINVRTSRSGRLVVLWSASRDTSEVWVLDAAATDAAPRSVGGRRPGVEYHAEHAVLPDGEALLLVTNDAATEFRLARCPLPLEHDQDHGAWLPLVDENPAERLERVDAFAGHVVLSLRTQGEHRLRVLPVDGLGRVDAQPAFDIRPDFAAGTVTLGHNQEFAAGAVTVVDQAYTQPPVWSDVDLVTGARTPRHRQQAPGHDPDRYVAETRTFPGEDGTAVPVTIVRHRDTPLDGTAPALLYAYGAYEYSFEPDWDPALPSLLDRGVVFAHAHVRGGGEGGRRWWLDGRLGHKQHTFDDHLAVADGLAGLVDGDRLASRGLSAGGLLQGAVFSQRPERWRAVVAEVPFVDVVTTMFDADVPLTINEWDEWGDPRVREQFDWLLAYSPYDNLPAAGNRPDLLVTGALHDPRVMVSEPAKWVAALRESDPQWSPRCLFRCETGAGAHAGPSGRFAHLAYEAEVYAWVLDRLRVTDAPVSSRLG
ncbi:prolyl oligopeptidase family serine peptidase [Angustibacter luteus]|uniref:Prolyl oligopeptidase family serine peptidase n=1 Tax=Angustibacter luteus TaxID=658456 RepID=A0ABW1JCI6_9ACTN